MPTNWNGIKNMKLNNPNGINPKAFDIFYSALVKHHGNIHAALNSVNRVKNAPNMALTAHDNALCNAVSKYKENFGE
jgi:hypothetical protein